MTETPIGQLATQADYYGDQHDDESVRELCQQAAEQLAKAAQLERRGGR